MMTSSINKKPQGTTLRDHSGSPHMIHDTSFENSNFLDLCVTNEESVTTESKKTIHQSKQDGQEHHANISDVDNVLLELEKLLAMERAKDEKHDRHGVSADMTATEHSPCISDTTAIKQECVAETVDMEASVTLEDGIIIISMF